jgi:hypothetical protein
MVAILIRERRWGELRVDGAVEAWAEILRAAVRNSDGVAAKCRRKVRLKYDRSSKPALKATALIVQSAKRGSMSMRYAHARRWPSTNAENVVSSVSNNIWT